MVSISTTAGGAGAAILAGVMLMTASPAWPAAAGRRDADVPCSSASLAGMIRSASGPTLLRLAQNCTYTITTPSSAETGLPAITGDIALVGGPSTTIRRDPAGAAFRVLDVAAGGRLRVAGITILDGNTAGLGGGIQNAGSLVLEGVTLSGNSAGNGGAVANLAGATAMVWRTLFSENATTGVGGGGILNSGRLTVNNSVFRANTAPTNGGGVNTQPSGVTQLIQSTVEENTSGSLGGGLSNLGTTTLSRTLVKRNQGSAGGGIATANATVLLSRSVVRDNRPDNCTPQNTIADCVD